MTRCAQPAPPHPASPSAPSQGPLEPTCLINPPGVSILLELELLAELALHGLPRRDAVLGNVRRLLVPLQEEGADHLLVVVAEHADDVRRVLRGRARDARLEARATDTLEEQMQVLRARKGQRRRGARGARQSIFYI